MQVRINRFKKFELFLRKRFITSKILLSKMVEEKSVRWGNRALLIAGILLASLGIIFIFLREYQDAYTETILGLTFILCALLFSTSQNLMIL